MAKKRHTANRSVEASADGSRAINKFRVSDAVMMLFIILLCATCILPFLHVAVKSISGNSHVLAKQVYFWPKGINFDAYASIFRDGSLQKEIKRETWDYLFINDTHVFFRRHHSHLRAVLQPEAV